MSNVPRSTPLRLCHSRVVVTLRQRQESSRSWSQRVNRAHPRRNLPTDYLTHALHYLLSSSETMKFGNKYEAQTNIDQLFMDVHSLSVSGRPCYILSMFFLYFLWPPYSPAQVVTFGRLAVEHCWPVPGDSWYGLIVLTCLLTVIVYFVEGSRTFMVFQNFCESSIRCNISVLALVCSGLEFSRCKRSI